MIHKGTTKELQRLEHVLVQLFGPLKKEPDTMIQYPELGIALLRLIEFNNTVFLKLLDLKKRTNMQGGASPTWKARKAIWLQSMDQNTATQILDEVAHSGSGMDYHESVADMYGQFIDSHTFMNDKLAGLHFLAPSSLKKVPDIESETLGKIRGADWLRIIRLLSGLQLRNLKSLGDQEQNVEGKPGTE